MATNIPPHNLREVIDATLLLIDNPEASDEELLEKLPGPDFPTGGIIQGRSGIQLAYRTGRGCITLRGRADFEEIRKDRMAIIVTEVPFMVNKARWIEAAAQQVRDKRLEGISDIRDESDRNGIRVVFELKRDANEQVVLNNLYKQTQLQTSFRINLLAIVNGRPVQLLLREALQVFIDHRKEVVTRRSLYDLRQARDRREIVEGLGLAIMQVDRVIEIIRSSKDTDEAKTRLMAEKMGGLDGFLERAGRPEEEVAAAREQGFVHLSPRQAQAILDMRLGRLTGLEREKLEAEYKELWETTDYLEGLLADDVKLIACIVDELQQVREQYGDERRTEIVDAEGEILHEELIAEEKMVVTRTHLGYVKRTPVSQYQAQNRGGRGIKGAGSADDDFVTDMFVASTHDYVLIFTSHGRVYMKKVYELPAGSRTAKGRPFNNVVDLQADEEVVSLQSVPEGKYEGRFVFMATQQGTVKKTDATAFEKIRSSGIKAIGISDGDRLVDVRICEKDMDVILTTRSGSAIRFQEDQVRPMGREARGVRGINLRDGDQLVGMVAFPRDSQETLLTVCERGYGKRTALSEFPTKNRGGYGVISVKTSDRNGLVTGVRLAADEDHLILISNKGRLIRMRVADISVMGRATQGVRVMRIDDDEVVASIERVADPDETDEEGKLDGAEPSIPEEALAGDTVPVNMEEVVEEGSEE
jgi:DNA gyrase subunit A